jgi:hypothetical protein
MQSNLHFSWQNSLSLAISQMHLLVQLSGKTWLQACSILALLGSVRECLMLIYILTKAKANMIRVKSEMVAWILIVIER